MRDVYIKKKGKVRGPYSWEELKEFVDAGKLRERELISDSPRGPFRERNMRNAISIELVERKKIEIGQPQLLIRFAGMALMIINLIAMVTTGVGWGMRYLPGGLMEDPPQGMSADNRLGAHLLEALMVIFFFWSIITLPGHLLLFLVRGFWLAWACLFFYLLTTLILVIPFSPMLLLTGLVCILLIYITIHRRLFKPLWKRSP
ncbi:MAG: hypothetical protein KDA65_08190 [Planctomycetaceae bacterium]|nr:hypothetical protein [Planctomycetaceae bacterium]